MTRINVGVKPKELNNQHLLAEHREIKRIPNCISSGRYNMDGIPKEFTLGLGHVKFFYNKQQYLLDRYLRIHKECLKRGFNVQNYAGAWDGVPKELMNDYIERPKDRAIILERIKERLTK